MGQRMMHDDVSTVRGNRIEEGVSIAKIMLTQATVWGFTLDIIRAIVVAIRFTKACGARSRSVIVGSGYVLSFFPTPAIGNAKTSWSAEDTPSADTWILRTKTQLIRMQKEHIPDACVCD